MSGSNVIAYATTAPPLKRSPPRAGGSPLARQLLPSKRSSSITRQYISARGGGACSNTAANAGSLLRISRLTLPGSRLSPRPLTACRPGALGMLHKGPDSRGMITNKTSIKGNAKPSADAAERKLPRHGAPSSAAIAPVNASRLKASQTAAAGD